jgi:hypothetical protein
MISGDASITVVRATTDILSRVLYDGDIVPSETIEDSKKDLVDFWLIALSNQL